MQRDTLKNTMDNSKWDPKIVQGTQSMLGKINKSERTNRNIPVNS